MLVQISVSKPDLVKTIISVSKRVEKKGDFNVSEEDIKEIILLCEKYKYHKTNANDDFAERVEIILDRIIEGDN